MKPELWKVSVRTTAEWEEAVAEVLQAQFGEATCTYTDVENRATEVSLFLKSKPDWRRGKLELSRRLHQIRSCGLDPGSRKPSLVAVPYEDWAESWKRHFHPLEIGSKLLIKPSWSKRRARQGQAVIVLDPGLSFGTGQHPTTLFCLRELVARRRPGKSQSFLDVGTGSGILAIAAARLGYAPIEAWDCDPQALRVARDNAKLNRSSPRIRFSKKDVAKLRPNTDRQFSVVCANLASNLLIDNRERIRRRCQFDGVLIVAGILRCEFAEVRRSYQAAGLQLVLSRAQGEWQSGIFRTGSDA